MAHPHFLRHKTGKDTLSLLISELFKGFWTEMGDFFPDLSKVGRIVETKRGEKCKKVLPDYSFYLILHPENSKDDNIAAVKAKKSLI